MECNWSRYRGRLERVTDYVHAHLDEDLDFAKIAEIACLSPWHWHRVYRGIYGETVTATVKRLRLQRAAAELANTSAPMAGIARRAGYPSVQSFTRIFKASYGMAPAAYRAGGSHAAFERNTEAGANIMYDVEIRDTGAIEVAGVAHSGPYMEIGRSFEKLFGVLFAEGLYRPEMRMIGVYYDDPDIVPAEKLRSFAAVSVDTDFVAVPSLQRLKIEAGRFAVLTHKGPYADMPKAYRWLFGAWLASSGHEVGDGPSFEIYLNNPRETAPADLLTEIWMPLAS